MIVAIVAPCLLMLTSAVAYVVFRRRWPRKLELPKGLPQNVSLLESPLSNKEIETLADAFLAGEDFAWMADVVKATDDEAANARHRNVTRFMIRCMIVWAEKYGYILVQRDDDNDELMGCIAIIPPHPCTSWEKFKQKAQFLRCVVPFGMPVPQKYGGIVEKRFDAFVNGTEKSKEHLMKNSQCWYVNLLAVAPAAQGKGVGRKLVAAGIALAQLHQKAPFYLDCHNGNVRFYERCGFVRRQGYEIQEKDPAEGAPTLQYNSMLYTMS